jgi:hypothetical protein
MVLPGLKRLKMNLSGARFYLKYQAVAGRVPWHVPDIFKGLDLAGDSGMVLRLIQEL